MKRNLAIFALLIGAFLFFSCEKTPQNEWSRFFGYTKADVVGHYEANPNDEYYPEIPTEGVTVYRNVSIDIIDLGADQNLVRFHIVIPEVINKIFSGVIRTTENESELAFHNGDTEDVLITVYKNNKGQVRLEGRERRCRYDAHNELIDCTIHGFDVLKAEDR